jgi:hypothetical protein
VNLRRKL